MAQMKVLMFLYSLNPAAGVEQYVVSILPELKNQGVTTIFCVEQPPDPTNQYYLQLQASNFRVHYPHLGPHPVRGWCWLFDLMLWLLFPVTICLILADQVVRGRSWNEAYTGLRGRLNNMTKSWLPTWIQSVPVWVMLTWLWLRCRPALLHVLRVDSVAALEWGNALNRPTIYTEALEPDGFIYYPQLAASYKRIERIAKTIPLVVTQSVRVKNEIEKKWGAVGNVRILPWVVTIRPYTDHNCDKTESDVTTFGSAGRLSSEKNIETFLDAAKLLLANYVDRIRVVVAGAGPAESDLKQYAAAIGIGEYVNFSGAYSLETMPSVFGSLDVFVISSLTEGAPLAVIEAMAYGKPVIATDVAGTGELIVNGVTGFLVQARDSQGIARACETFLDKPCMLQEMGKAAIERYRETYTPKIGAKQLYDLYVELIDPKVA
jgi:glycosyltransferase involved in cell wall biosynthesis